jgi:hypothetical protein
MKQKIYILLSAALTALAGCIHDRQPEAPAADADGSVTLSIALPAPVVKDMGRTRGVEDFYNLDDLNIVIADGEDDDSAVLYNLFFRLSEVEDSEVINGATYTVRGDGHGIHFPEEWFERYELSSETATFFVVGNYGEAIDVATVGALRAVRYVSDIPGSPGSRNVLYGESADWPDSPHEVLHPEGRSLKVELERLVAMITVAIDGTLLDPSIEIIPTSISLHNVPLSSSLGANDIDGIDPPATSVSGNNADMTPNGESFSGALLGWGSVGSGGTSGLGNTLNSFVGRHYTESELSVEAPDYHALFMLENIHGDDFGAENSANESTGKSKRPAGITDTETAIGAAADAFACSYLEVRAEYYRYENGSIAQGGDITYRVFLGGNIYDNFDVKRNTYYRYTLMLSGLGGRDEASWRVDTDLSEISVLDESDFTLNAAGEMIFIDELITKLNANMGIFYVDDTEVDVNGSVYSYIVSTAQGGWTPFPTGQSQMYNGPTYAVVDPDNDQRSQFRIYVEPMTTTDGVEPNEGYMRKISFYFGINSGHYTSQNITITQYAPKIIEVSDPTDPKLTPEIKAQIMAAGIEPDLPFVIYFDRVDRRGLPWGFEGQTITNAGTGTENGIALLGTTAGAGYMPFGKPGSAVMHAAYINVYQTTAAPAYFTNNTQWTPAPSIDRIRSAAGDNPTNPIVPNSIPSRAEWKLLEMLDRAGFGVFDSRHDIVPWQPDWTSDAVDESSSQSWAYRRNAQGSFVNVDRTSPLPYRMIYVEQQR